MCIRDSGKILETPKTAWRYFDLLGTIQNELNIPCGYDTDVNVACLGEVTFGCAQGLTDVVYLTIGTGVGAGVLSGGKLVHGMMHPEAGHILVTRDPRAVSYTHLDVYKRQPLPITRATMRRTRKESDGID